MSDQRFVWAVMHEYGDCPCNSGSEIGFVYDNEAAARAHTMNDARAEFREYIESSNRRRKAYSVAAVDDVMARVMEKTEKLGRSETYRVLVCPDYDGPLVIPVRIHIEEPERFPLLSGTEDT